LKLKKRAFAAFLIDPGLWPNDDARVRHSRNRFYRRRTAVSALGAPSKRLKRREKRGGDTLTESRRSMDQTKTAGAEAPAA
jgi:hypothetical protein